MASQHPTEQQLRAQYAASGLARVGVSYETAMQLKAISISLVCGAHAAERAAQYHDTRPHWSDRKPT